MSWMTTRDRLFETACRATGTAARLLGFRASAPFVIIGTGRTGSNLLEDVLRSHRGISSFPTEANELWHPALEPFDSSKVHIPPIEIDPRHFSEVSVAHWPARHAGTIHDTFLGYHWWVGASQVLVIKSAMISFLIPQILDVWPDARLIHIYRFGLAVVDSYSKKNFGKYRHYSYTEQEYREYCAKYWNACILEIERQKQALSLDARGKLLELSYESLCERPAEIIGQLAAFLCLDPGGFTYNVAHIADQNYKTAGYAHRPDGQALLKLMTPGLALKGYPVDESSPRSV